jgi:hypothetical protein
MVLPPSIPNGSSTLQTGMKHRGSYSVNTLFGVCELTLTRGTSSVVAFIVRPPTICLAKGQSLCKGYFTLTSPPNGISLLTLLCDMPLGASLSKMMASVSKPQYQPPVSRLQLRNGLACIIQSCDCQQTHFVCGRSAKMSPQNCLAIMSPCWVGSSPQRRRSDEL